MAHPGNGIPLSLPLAAAKGQVSEMSEMGERYQEEQRREWREQNRLNTLLRTHVDRLLTACFVGDKRRLISGPSLRRDLERLAREAYQQGYTDGVREGGDRLPPDAT